MAFECDADERADSMRPDGLFDEHALAGCQCVEPRGEAGPAAFGGEVIDGG